MPSTIPSTTRSFKLGILFSVLLCVIALSMVSETGVQAQDPRLMEPLGEPDHVFHSQPPQTIPLRQLSRYQDNPESLLKPVHQTAPLAKVLEESPSVEPARVFQDTRNRGRGEEAVTEMRSAPFPEPGYNRLRDPSANRFSDRISTVNNTPIYPTNHLRPSENPPRTLDQTVLASAPAYSQALPESSDSRQQPGLLMSQGVPLLMPQDAPSLMPQDAPPLLAPQDAPPQLMPQEPASYLPQESQTALRPFATEATRLPASPTPLPPNSSKPIPLAPKGEASSGQKSSGVVPMLATMGGALLLVIGLFFVFAWTMKRTSRRTGGMLPQGVVEILGHQTITGRQRVHLLRIGRRLLLVSIMPDSIETLTEITDSEEVDRIAGICCQSGKGSSTDAFQAVMRQFAQDARISGRAPTVEQIRQRLSSKS